MSGEGMQNIYGITRQKLEDYFSTIQEKKYKALQVFEWLYQKKVEDISGWTNIKESVREKVKDDFSFAMPKIVREEQDTLTRKFLFLVGLSNKCDKVT